jgi:hypothetical protein
VTEKEKAFFVKLLAGVTPIAAYLAVYGDRSLERIESLQTIKPRLK